MSSHLSEAYALCADHVHEHDRDSWLECLFAPADQRAHLQSLFAFNAEIKRIPFLVSEPTLGEIRLQYWRDVLSPQAINSEQGGQGHPIAEALLATIAAHQLPVQPLLDLIDAHVFDLYQDPMPSLHDFEGYCGETIGAVLRLASLILAEGEEPGGAASLGHASVALGLVQAMQSIALHTARGQIYLPADILTKHEVDPKSILSQQMSSALQGALRELCDLARQHSKAALADLGSMRDEAKTAVLSLALVEPSLALFERRRFNPFLGSWLVPGWKRQWHIWRMSLKF